MKKLKNIYISDLRHEISSANELMHNFQIDNVRETKIIPNIIITQLPKSKLLNPLKLEKGFL